jgi:hypothetical protein
MRFGNHIEQRLHGAGLKPLEGRVVVLRHFSRLRGEKEERSTAKGG